MNQAEIAKWLGRSLTPTEVTNFDSYLKNAYEKVEELICFPLACGSETRTFKAREGMSTVFTGVFRDINEVKRNDVVVTDYETMFFDNLNGKYFNSIVFDCPLYKTDVITVDASWGFGKNCMPTDLQQLIAKYFALASSGVGSNSGIKSKKVEDFSVTFDDKTAEQRLIDDNQSVINKYSLCHIPNIQSNGVCRIWI